MSTVESQLAILTSGLNLTAKQQAQLVQNLAAFRAQTLTELDDDVAKAKEGSRVTRGGFDLLGKAIAGQELKYTRVVLGDSTVDGNLVELTTEQCVELTDVINPKMEAPMTDVAFTGAGTATIKFSIRNQNITQGFWIREIGVYAEDPDTGDEVLYCYRNSGILSEYMPGGDGSVVWDIIMTIITVVDTATNVTAVIDANLAYVSQSEFSLHINSSNPHPNAPTLGREVTATNAVWVQEEDSNLHKMSIENLARQVLGGDASNIPKMNSRLSEVEVNIANLYMQLNAEKELGLTANLLLVEDFADDSKCCDKYSCPVVTAVAGVSNIQVESDKDILSGCWYTITDGVNSEYVQVKSVIRNGNAYVVLFEQSLLYTYNLDNTILMRSTVLVGNDEAQGAGDVRGTTYTFDETWRGQGGNVATTLVLKTTQKNSSSFSITGNGGFTPDGEFTLVA